MTTPLQALLDRLRNYKSPGIWVHEKKLDCLVQNNETESKRGVITSLIKAVKKGYIGSKSEGNFINGGAKIDLAKEDNTLGFFYVTHGEENFSTHSLSDSRSVSAKVRWFYFKGEPNGCKKPSSPKVQQQIVKWATGEYQNARTDVAKRHWKAWYNNGVVPSDYKNHIQRICTDFETNERTIRACISYSDKVKMSMQTRSSTPHSASPSHDASSSVVATLESNTNEVDRRSSASSNILVLSESLSRQSSSRTSTSVPVSLLLDNLRKLSVEELACIEKSLHDGDSTNATDDDVRSLLQSKSMRNISNAKKNVEKARKEFVKTQIFKPRNDQLMSSWLEEATRYNNGAALEAQNFVTHTGKFGSGRIWLSDVAASFIRHIIFSFKIPIRRFGGLLQC